MFEAVPIAHGGHYLWTLYIPPVLIVVFAIVRTMIVQRRQERRERAERVEKGGDRTER